MVRFWILFIVVIALLAFLAQLLSKFDIISRKMRVYFGILLLLLALGIGIFNFFQEKREDTLNDLAHSFLQGKSLICQVGTHTIEANNKSFNFISGTLTLMGKEESDYYRVTIPLKACQLKNATSH
ncbi:hypothetical protein [Helicobacter sp. MIT 05-5294]|uniref:hypothetical protein n=1 Tax=Helicobacter sp. MIT 05-5294 TaxID=1548150 RepID=UPI00051FBE5B|nr:hypothetical protein [Helicobacter sp. MIT 05-5294]TLD86296.1 hypothetical protein LS69_006275 [Helicobacter sp. MIT 05-5294]